MGRVEQISPFGFEPQESKPFELNFIIFENIFLLSPESNAGLNDPHCLCNKQQVCFAHLDRS